MKTYMVEYTFENKVNGVKNKYRHVIVYKSEKKLIKFIKKFNRKNKTYRYIGFKILGEV